jgi:thiol-disulfide isomerase/thioredoxin
MSLKFIIKLTLSTLLFFAALTPAFSIIRVTGEIRGMENVKEVEVTLPIGNYTNSFNKLYYPVINNKFSFDVRVSTKVFMQLRAGYKRVFLIVGPVGDINLTILNTNDKRKALVFDGANAAGLYWYNVYNYEPLLSVMGHGQLFDALNAKTKDETLVKLGRFFGSQTQPLEELYKQGKIDAQLLSLAKTDIRAKNALNIVQRLTALQDKISDKNDIQKYAVLIKALWKFAGPNNTENYRSCFGANFLMDYYSNHPDGAVAESPIWNNYSGYLNAPDSIKCFLLGNALVFSKVVGTNEFNYDKALAQYKKEFPGSAYVAFLNSLKAPADKVPAEEVKLDTALNFNTLADLTKHFKGKPVYVDLWASWCIPCREEFPYYKKVLPLLKRRNITPVFISIDKPDAKIAWQDLIAQNNLAGHHVLINKKLMADIKKRVYKNGEVSIPRYLIVSKNGEISNWDAPRPSNPALPGIINKL